MEKKQSSVEWLIQQFNGNTSRIANMMGVKKYNSIIEKSKAMHKKEIKNAWKDGEGHLDNDSQEEAEWYYQKIYGDGK